MTLVLEILRRLRGRVRDIRSELREHTRRFGRIERRLAGFVVAQIDAGRRLDILTERVERLERRHEFKLLAISEDAVRIERRLSPVELPAEVRRLGLRTYADSAATIRADRDSR